MKITNNELRAYFQAYMDRRSPSSTRPCPRAKDLNSFFNSRIRKTRKAKIIDHLTRCETCANDFRWLLELERERRRFEIAVETVLAELLPAANMKKRQRGKIFLSFGFWQYAAMIVGAIFLSASLVTLIQKNAIFSSHRATTRAPSQFMIRLIGPVQESMSRSQLVFEWRPVASVEYYNFELFDETLKLIWKSPNLRDKILVLPQDIRAKLKPMKIHFWMITARLPNGIQIESQLAKFHLLE